MVIRTVFLLALELLDDVVNFAAHLRIEAGGRLVEEDDLGIVDQRHGQRQALLLPAGKLAVEGRALFFQLEALQEFVGVGMVAIEVGEEVDRFLHAQLVRQGSGLQDRADLFLEFLARLFRDRGRRRAPSRGPACASLPGFRRWTGLAGAVRAEQAEDFALLHGEAHAPQRFHGAVIFIEIFDLDNRLCH